MKNTENLIESRAVSPVIATVILVAVAITVAVGVSYWMSGIAGQYTDFEKIEIKSVTQTDVAGNWQLIVTLKNSGSATATMDSIFVNDAGVTLSSTVPTGSINTLNSSMADTGLRVESGQELPITVWIGADYGELSSGTTVNLKIHSAGGMDYIKLVKLR